MQAALRDLTPTRNTNPRPFLICQRVLHRCHQIVFGDPPEPSRSPYRSLPHSPQSSTAALLATKSAAQSLRLGFQAKDEGDRVYSPPTKVKPHIHAAMAGMGVVLAGVPGMPPLTDLVGGWAVTQGRKTLDEHKESRDRVELDISGGADGRIRGSKELHRKPSEESALSEEEEESRPSTQQPRPNRTSSTTRFSPPSMSSPQFDISYSPAMSSSSRQKGEDPFSQETPPEFPVRSSTPPTDHSPFYSVPEFSGHHHSALHRLRSADRPPTPEMILATYSPDAQRQLLRGHYCRSEIRFLLLLEDISNRLLVVPKPARVSALRAELTGLNHNLPAEVSHSMIKADPRSAFRCGALQITRTSQEAKPLPEPLSGRAPRLVAQNATPA